MDVQKEVEEFLLEWDEIKKNNVKDKVMEKISKFNKEKNIRIFLKLMIINLDKQANQIITDMKDLSLLEKRKYIVRFRKEKEKIECIRKILKNFKNNEFEKKGQIILSSISNEEDSEVVEINNSIETKTSNDINLSDLPSATLTFSEFIRECDIINDNEKVIQYSDDLCNEMIEYFYDKNEIFVEFNYLLNALKNKINEYDRYSDERKLLKNIQKRFKSIYNIYKDTNIKEDKNVYFDIIDYYLEKENYFQVQELLKRKPEICNLTNENGHIVLYILKKYIENFKRMTKDKTSDYVNTNFLKEVYMLFVKSPSLRIKYEDRQKIDSTLNEFYNYINSTLIKRKRKLFALREVKSMKSSNFYCYKEQCNMIRYSDDNLGYEKQRIINMMNDYVNKFQSDECEKAFVVGDTAYSLHNEEGTIKLKIHSLDVSNFIRRKSVMNIYFEQCELLKEKIDEFILRGFKFQKNNQYPTISYELEFYPSGKIKSMNINKNVINITEVYNTMYNKTLEQKEFYELFSKSVCKNGGTLTTFDTYIMNNHFNDLLNNLYTEFIKKNLLPFIYYGYRNQTKKELDDDKNFLSSKLSDLNKEDSMELLHILTSRIDMFHYSQYPIDNPTYDLKLVHNINYLGLENQRMLNDIYFNQRQIEDPKELLQLRKQYYQYYDKKVDELNNSINYVDMSKIKKYRSKMLVKKNF